MKKIILTLDFLAIPFFIALLKFEFIDSCSAMIFTGILILLTINCYEKNDNKKFILANIMLFVVQISYNFLFIFDSYSFVIPFLLYVVSCMIVNLVVFSNSVEVISKKEITYKVIMFSSLFILALTVLTAILPYAKISTNIYANGILISKIFLIALPIIVCFINLKLKNATINLFLTSIILGLETEIIRFVYLINTIPELDGFVITMSSNRLLGLWLSIIIATVFSIAKMLKSKPHFTQKVYTKTIS